jgi:hypothetical protein
MENVFILLGTFSIILYCSCIILFPIEKWIISSRDQKREKQARLHVEETLGQELLFSDFCIHSKGPGQSHHFNLFMYEDCFIADGYIMKYSSITEVEYYAPYGQRKAHFYVRFKERFRGKFCSEGDEAIELWPFLKGKCEVHRNTIIREY